MKQIRSFLITATLFTLCSVAQAQEFGLSFSYFLPKNGYFSTPISPFSIRGLGVDLNRFVALETGASLYRMSGLNLKDLSINSKEPLVGPNFTLLIPAELVFQLRGSVVQFDIKGGGFFFYGFGNKINYGNLDRAIIKSLHPDWTVANANVTFDNSPGFGYHGGAELTLYFTSQVGVSLETNYFVGSAKFPLKGSYVGGQSSIETYPLDEPEAKLDFTGLEFSIGLLFNSGGGGGPRKKPGGRRRR
ncbi:hypothetical protein KK083_02840 [Fulvivirgaceae bacterium PWU4]|uniref:Outer membrane protein beta-barrel domain-containing protein n=1 Tax=Chryseosolibacter histidini TaxID=2782349 RepID=A0AAP2GLH1_9BACT|nr:hypothetical protein [Chryseosolibacter histidini]MBT1695798.1 hypothetical protein [Chryseosolibacter histidini]